MRSSTLNVSIEIEDILFQFSQLDKRHILFCYSFYFYSLSLTRSSLQIPGTRASEATRRMNFWLHLDFSQRRNFIMALICTSFLIIHWLFFFYKIRLFCTWLGLSHELCKLLNSFMQKVANVVTGSIFEVWKYRVKEQLKQTSNLISALTPLSTHPRLAGLRLRCWRRSSREVFCSPSSLNRRLVVFTGLGWSSRDEMVSETDWGRWGCHELEEDRLEDIRTHHTPPLPPLHTTSAQTSSQLKRLTANQIQLNI